MKTRRCFLLWTVFHLFFCFALLGREEVRLRSDTEQCCPLRVRFEMRQLVDDPSGATYVTGYVFNPPNDEDYSTYDILTIKFDSGGGVLWTNRYDGGGYDVAAALALDANGNVFVVGTSTVCRDCYPAIVTLKYAPNGAPLWTNLHYGRFFGGNYGAAIEADRLGNVAVAGLVTSGAGPGRYESDIIKYDPAGAMIWANHNVAGRLGEYLAADSDENIVFVGASETNVGIIAKYSSEGVPLWTNSFARDGWDFAAGVSVDSQGAVLALFSSGIVTRYGDSYTLYPGCAVTKYAPDGNPLWTNRFDQPSTAPQAIITDSRDSVYVAVISPAFSAGNVITIKFAAEGPVQWSSTAENVNPNFVNTPLRFLAASTREVVLTQDYFSDGFIDVLLFDYLQPARNGKGGR